MTDEQARNRALRDGVLWNLIPVVLLGVVGLGLTVGIGAWWGTGALGVFNQVTTAYFVLAVVGAGSINYSVLRAVAERPDDADRVAAIVVGGLVPTVVLAALITPAFVAGRFVLAATLDSDAVAAGILWVAPGLFCFIVNKVLLGVVNGLGRMRAYAVYTSLRYVLIGLGLVIAKLRGVPAEQLPAIWSLTEGVLLLVLGVELVRTVALHRAAGWSRWARDHLDFGTRGAGATLLFEINSRLDVWLLGIAMSDVAVGIYSMAASMAEGVSQLAVAVQVNLNPRMAAALAAGRRDDVETLVRTTRRWFVPAMVAGCALAAAGFPIVIPWLTGQPDFFAAALPFALLMAGLAVVAPWQPFNQILLMGARPGWHTTYVALGVALNITGNLWLIPRIGLAGAAAATAVALVLSVVILMRMSRGLLAVRL